MDKIEQITDALQKLIFYSYKSFLKNNDGFEIEDERNGYESEQFTDEIQTDCGIEFLRATTERYGADYTLHYGMVGWLADLFSAYKLPLAFTSDLQNRSGGDQAYINSLGYVSDEIKYDLTALSGLSKDDLLTICDKLEAQVSFLTLKYQ
jgi:hypothetical protein